MPPKPIPKKPQPAVGGSQRHVGGPGTKAKIGGTAAAAAGRGGAVGKASHYSMPDNEL